MNRNKASSTSKASSWSQALFPSLHHRKDGWLHRQENIAKPPKPMQTGWFSLPCDRKTTPSSRSAEASRYLFDRSATPPCGDARRGISLDFNSFTAREAGGLRCALPTVFTGLDIPHSRVVITTHQKPDNRRRVCDVFARLF